MFARRRLLLLDAVGLLAALSCLSYLLRHDRAGNAYRDLWVNLSVDLFGIWLGVRFIDALIRSRQNMINARRSLVSNVRNMSRLVEELLPHVYEWHVSDLAREVKWFEGTLPQRARYLSMDERDEVTEFVVAGKKVIKSAQQYIRERDRIRDMDVELGVRLDDHNTHAQPDERVYRYEIAGLSRLDQSYRRYLEKRDVDESGIAYLVQEVRGEARGVALPDEAMPALQSYLDAIAAFPSPRSELLRDVNTLASLGSKVDANVSAEQAEFD